MPRHVWMALWVALATSLCAFGQDQTQWQVQSNDNQGKSCALKLDCGTYTYGTAGGDLVASDVLLNNVDASGPGSTNALLPSDPDIIGGYLDFTSGAYDPLQSAAASAWVFDSGAPGSLKIWGCIAGVVSSTGTGNAATCSGMSNDVVLASDEFTSVTVQDTSSSKIVIGSLTGFLNPTLAKDLGISQAFSDTSAVLDGISFSGKNPSLKSTFTANSTGGTLTLTAPEGWSVFGSFSLFIIGLAAFRGARRFNLLESVKLLD